MNKKVEANTAATQTAMNDVKQVQNELDYTQEQLVLKTVSAKEALQDAALNADEQLSTHLQAKQEVARIELTKSKVKLTKELESLQTQIDNLGNEVGVPGSGIDEGLIAGLEAAKVEVEKAIIATNEDIQRVETTLYKTHDAMELMNKKVEANTAATQTAMNDVKQVQNELDYTQEQLVLKTVSAKEALQDAALNADEQLSTHLQAKQEVARIELTKSKVKLTKELESLQTQIDNLGNEVGV
ncbi:hypothetical protein MSG37_21205, partial [Shewanella sp. 1CM18E]|uniref:hypothetical protein n=1 Tax=Shewanella sp. 1CM18E TaxID=2929169 RepID=UPI0020BE3F58